MIVQWHAHHCPAARCITICKLHKSLRGLLQDISGLYCRQAFAELYAGQAREMAERMGRLRQKECDKRDAFKKHIQGYIPVPVLAGLCLTQQPAHCQISLPPQAPGTPTVTLADLRRAPMSVDPAVRVRCCSFKSGIYSRGITTMLCNSI